MILRSATEAGHVFEVPAASLPADTGFHPIRQLARVDVGRVDLRWRQVDHATLAAVRQHWSQYGQRGIPFVYEPPGVTLPPASYTYDGPLVVTREGSRNVSISVSVTQSLAFD